MQKSTFVLAATALVTLLLATATSGSFAKEYILAAGKPNNLYLVDADAREVVRTCTLPGRGGPIHISPSPDNSVAYVLTNGWGEVVGVKLDNCEVVFHAVLSQGNVRARSMAGMTVSRDGSELYVQVSEVELLPDRYQIRDPHRVLVYRTETNLEAEPYRSFDIPRGHTIIVPSHDGETLWSFGHEIRQFDATTGAIKQEILLNSWEDLKPTYGDPDGLSFWSLYDNIDVAIFPYFVPVFEDREARDAGNWDKLADFPVGVTMVDLRTNEWTQQDIMSADVLIFSMATNPKNPNELFGVYTQLSKYDLEKGELTSRVDLDHTYYTVQVAADGDEVYVGSTFNDIGIYSTATLEKVGQVDLPGGDQAAVGFRVIHR